MYSVLSSILEEHMLSLKVDVENAFYQRIDVEFLGRKIFELDCPP